MNDAQRVRYSRHIFLPSLGEHGQERLLTARVLVVGVGGLGSAVALYLAAAGVGHLVLSDPDRVDPSNLQRQIIHRHADVGRLKTDSARDALLALNPEIQLTCLPQILVGSELEEVVRRCAVVIDACDNFETRFTLNRVCHRLGVPLVSGAALGTNGQVAVFSYQKETPCYQCLYPEQGSLDETCAQVGVLASLVGIIGATQATEAVKVITGMGELLVGRVLLFDALRMEWRTLRLRQDPACSVCRIMLSS